MIRLILLTFTIFTLIACSPQSEVTKAQLRVSVGALSSTLTPSEFPGGLILYGKEIGGNKVFSRHLNTMISDEIIPNGRWRFVIIGWDDDGSGAMSGKPYCDSVIADLTGNDIQVNLNATNLKCANLGPTWDNAGDKEFYSPRIKSCNILNQLAYTDNCEYDTGVIPRKRTKGYASSFRIIAKPFDNFGGGLNFQTNNTTNFVAADTNANGCTQLNDTNVLSAMVNEPTITANLPITNTNLPFFFTIRAYLNSTDCDDTKAYKDIIYHSKVFTAQDHANTKLLAKGHLDTSTNNEQIIFVKTTLADVCASSRGTYSSGTLDSPFSGGTGTKQFPYVICNESQLSKIESIYETNSFMLGRNLDLHPFTAFLHADTVADFQESKSNPIPCTNNRNNYVPIGGFDSTVEMADVCTGSAANPLTASTNNGGDSFTGVFDGNGKTIKHLRFDNDEFMNVGFIRVAGSGMKLFDLTFDKMELRGNDNVGLIGGASGTPPIVVVDNVTIKDSYIQAKTDSNGSAGDGTTEVDANVGSLVGFGQYADTSSISNIFVENTIVETEGEFSGGVIGQLENTDLKNISFDGMVFCQGEGSSAACNSLGGIAGSLNGNFNAHSLVSRGFVESKGYTVGGLIGGIGNVDAGTSIVEDMYSTAYVRSDIQAINLMIGGLIGSSASTNSTVREGYFAGAISHDCNYSATSTASTASTASTDCEVSPTIGKNSGQTATDLYAVSQLEDPQAGNFVTAYNVLAASTALTTLNHQHLVTSNATKTTIFNGTGTNQFNKTNTRWANMTGYNGYPYLDFEKERPCNTNLSNSSISVQMTAGRGQTESNPVYICKPSQFQAMLSFGGSQKKYFELGDHINMAIDSNILGTPNTVGDNAGEHPNNWPHQLDGNNRLVYELYNEHGTISSGNFGGLFNSIASGGVLKNISFMGGRVNSISSHDGKYGLIVGQNNGTLQDVIVDGSVDLNGLDKHVALLAGQNNGSIKDCDVRGVVVANSYVAGAVVENTTSGDIERLNVEAKLYSNATATGDFFGGIVASNNGSIKESLFTGEIDNSADTSFNGSVGGITAYNNTNGSVIDCYVDGEVQINLGGSTGIAYVGGVVGESAGTVNRVVSLARIISDIANYSSASLGGVVGKSSGGSISNAFYYMANAYVGSSQSSNYTNFNCSGSGEVQIDIGATTSFVLNASGVLLNPIVYLENGGDNFDYYRLTGDINGDINATNANNPYTLNITTTDSTKCPLVNDTNLYSTPQNVYFYGENQANSLGTRVSKFWQMGSKSTYAGFNMIKFDNTLTNAELDTVQNFYDSVLTTGVVPAGSPVWELSDDGAGLPKLFKLDQK